MSEHARGPTAGEIRARVVQVENKRAEVLNQAISEQWCNGCHKAKREWGPVCSGMPGGDATHFHSPEWWADRVNGLIP